MDRMICTIDSVAVLRKEAKAFINAVVKSKFFATEDNFGENMGNLTDNTSSNILLRTNITDRLVQHEYDVFLDINY